MSNALLPLLCVALSATASLVADELSFPEFKDLKPPLLLPPDATLSVDSDGNYCHNGKPRFLIGAQLCYSMEKSDLLPCEGYPSALKWLYETPLSYESAQRIGLDTISTFSTVRWIADGVDPSFQDATFLPAEYATRKEIWHGIHLPLQVDYTCFEWGHGKLAEPPFKDKFPEDMFNPGGARSEGNHWVPYCLNHPKTREIYKMIWESGAQEAKESGAKPFIYELFNEPAYNDFGVYNRKLFAARIKALYKTPQEMDRVWGSAYGSFEAASNFKSRNENPGLLVDWCKFMEDSFADFCRYGTDVISKLDSSARFSVQSCGDDIYRALPKSGVNHYKLSRLLSTTETSTGGGAFISNSGEEKPAASAIDTASVLGGISEGMLQRHFYKALADGKPIFDGEAYSGQSYDSLRGMLWLELVRGGNAAYMFIWSKRPWDKNWKPQGSIEGGRKVATLFPFLILNPNFLPPSALTAIMDFKKEMLKLDDLFVPRKRGVESQIAILLSFPTERRAPAIGNVLKNEICTYNAALELSQHQLDAILEEQLPEGRASRYKVIVAAGVRNIYPETAKHLLRFVSDGGILVAGLEPMPEDEYGHPIDWQGLFDFKRSSAPKTPYSGELSLLIPRYPLLQGPIKARENLLVEDCAGWEVLGILNGHPAVMRKSFGKGWVYFIAPTMPSYSLSAVLNSLLSTHKVEPVCQLSQPEASDLIPNVETHCAKRDGRTAFFLLNWDNYPKLARLEAPAFKSGAARDVFASGALPVVNSGVMVMLPPKRPVVVVAGQAAELASLYGEAPVLSPESLKGLCAKQQAEIDAQKAKISGFKFTPDATTTRTLNLRPFCNRDFVDTTAGDGKGGWTDQGAENSLQGVPWDTQNLLGVPCDLIRPDMNEYRACIVMDSKNLPTGFGVKKIECIPVDEKVKALYFFHVSAWTDDGSEVFRYRIKYASGRELELPVICGENIADWWLSRPSKLKDFIAWHNAEERGFHCWRWENPVKEDEINSIDILSASGKSIGIIIGITVEGVGSAGAASSATVNAWKFPEDSVLRGWNGCVAKWQDGQIVSSLAEDATAWAGFTVSVPKQATPTPPDAKVLRNGHLRFSVNGCNDIWGKHIGGQLLQITLGFKDGKSGKDKFTIKTSMEACDSDPLTWQEHSIPLETFFEKETEGILSSCVFQFRGPPPGAGIAIKDLRLEFPKDEKSR